MYFLALQIIEIFYVINPAVQDRTSALFVRFMSHPVTEEHLPSALMKFYTGRTRAKYCREKFVITTNVATFTNILYLRTRYRTKFGWFFWF